MTAIPVQTKAKSLRKKKADAIKLLNGLIDLIKDSRVSDIDFQLNAADEIVTYKADHNYLPITEPKGINQFDFNLKIIHKEKNWGKTK